MAIYISKNNQQFGPYEEHVVLDQLRNGSLSSDDMAIRQGDASWQRLGDMFPNVVREPVAASSTASAASSDPAQSAKKGSGCLKFGLLGTGLLLLLLGIATAIGGQFIPSTSCDLLKSDEEKIDKLRRDLDRARNDGKYDRISSLEYEINAETAGAAASRKYCNDDKMRNNIVSGAGGVVGFIGLLMAIVSLFIKRKK
jgi:hypothetical protein